jgi:hypothetical protein
MKMRFLLIPIIAALAMVLLSGCAHNIQVQGFGFACPYGAMGYGTFSCVKDNVTVESNETTSKDGVTTTNKFTVGKQTTGYDVELKKAELSAK